MIQAPKEQGTGSNHYGDPDDISGLSEIVEYYQVVTWLSEETEVTDSIADRRYAAGDVIGRFTTLHVPGYMSANHALVAEETGVAVLGEALFDTNA